MSTRKQEKLGWTVGWLGGFVWVLILSVIFLVQGRMPRAVIGLVIGGASIATIFLASPWRHPDTTYRRLMIPIYIGFFVAVAWAVWASDDPRTLGIRSWWALFLLLPLLTPVWAAGRRRWNDGETRPGDAP